MGWTVSDPGKSGSIRVLERKDLTYLFSLLLEEGYRVVGPTIRDGAIVHGDIETPQDLPIGWTDDQSPGSYRLVPREDDRCFGFVAGAESWKRFLFPPRE